MDKKKDNDNNNKDKAYKMAGLAYRAGKVVCGEGKVLDNIRSEKAYLAVVSEDISENTYKKVCAACKPHNIKCIKFGDREVLGKYTARESSAVAAFTDKGFAETVEKLISYGINDI